VCVCVCVCVSVTALASATNALKAKVRYQTESTPHREQNYTDGTLLNLVLQ